MSYSNHRSFSPELWRLEGGGFDEVKLVVSGELTGEPQEGLLKVVIALEVSKAGESEAGERSEP